MTARRVLLAIDDVLFEAGGWFTIDAGNQRVPGVVAATLRAGLDLVGRGAVATVVGRLRAEVRVVDVDLVGDRATTAVDAIAAWCAQRGVWHLVRPSGGAQGRAHVFLAPGARLEALEAFLDGLRTQLRAGSRTVDLRRFVRPLSAPHRHGTDSLPPGDLEAILERLRSHPWASAAPIELTPPGVPLATPPPPDITGGAPRPTSTTSGAALVPRRQTRNPMPPAWTAYLERGVRPPLAGDDVQNRSNFEATATGFLLRAGHDADTAWAVICQAHPGAFVKARNRGRGWWVRHVWNPAVRQHDAFTPVPRIEEQLAVDVAAARVRLQDLAWTLPVARRPSLLLVMHAVMDRMLRTGSRRVPVPERDLVLDTGLADRKTIRAQLRLAHGQVGVLDTSCWDPRHKRASSSFEFEIPVAEGQGLRDIPPPSSHTPLPPGVWVGLPRPAHQLWRALLTSPEPLTTAELGQRAALTQCRGQSLSQAQVRAARDSLTALARAGLASCTEAGAWVARRTVDSDTLQGAARRRAPLQVRVEAERAAYRTLGGPAWDTARAAALKANRAREVAWWAALPHAERARRSTAWAGVYRGLSVAGQHQVKAQLADRRIRAGGSERVRHDRWLDTQSWDQVVTRSVEQAAWFAGLPPPLKQAYASAWDTHRRHYDVPRSTPLATSRLQFAAALPDQREVRDEQFLQDTLLPDRQDDADTG